MGEVSDTKSTHCFGDHDLARHAKDFEIDWPPDLLSILLAVTLSLDLIAAKLTGFLVSVSPFTILDVTFANSQPWKDWKHYEIYRSKLF